MFTFITRDHLSHVRFRQTQPTRRAPNAMRIAKIRLHDKLLHLWACADRLSHHTLAGPVSTHRGRKYNARPDTRQTQTRNRNHTTSCAADTRVHTCTHTILTSANEHYDEATQQGCTCKWPRTCACTSGQCPGKYRSTHANCLSASHASRPPSAPTRHDAHPESDTTHPRRRASSENAPPTTACPLRSRYAFSQCLPRTRQTNTGTHRASDGTFST